MSYGLSDMNLLIASLSPLLLGDFDGHMDWDGGWGVAMMIGMILFWAVVIVAIVWLVREFGTRTAHPRPDDDPLRILDRKLAEGSVSPDDYRERRAILDRSDASD